MGKTRCIKNFLEQGLIGFLPSYYQAEIAKQKKEEKSIYTGNSIALETIIGGCIFASGTLFDSNIASNYQLISLVSGSFLLAESISRVVIFERKYSSIRSPPAIGSFLGYTFTIFHKTVQYFQKSIKS